MKRHIWTKAGLTGFALLLCFGCGNSESTEPTAAEVSSTDAAGEKLEDDAANEQEGPNESPVRSDRLAPAERDTSTEQLRQELAAAKASSDWEQAARSFAYLLPEGHLGPAGGQLTELSIRLVDSTANVSATYTYSGLSQADVAAELAAATLQGAYLMNYPTEAELGSGTSFVALQSERDNAIGADGTDTTRFEVDGETVAVWYETTLNDLERESFIAYYGGWQEETVSLDDSDIRAFEVGFADPRGRGYEARYWLKRGRADDPSPTEFLAEAERIRDALTAGGFTIDRETQAQRTIEDDRITTVEFRLDPASMGNLISFSQRIDEGDVLLDTFLSMPLDP